MMLYLIPGSFDLFGIHKKVAKHFRTKGFPAKLAPFGFYVSPLKELSVLVRKDLEHIDQDVVIITASAGGLIAKYLLEVSPGLRNKVKKVVTVCTPFHGTRMAYAGFFLPVFRDLQPKSPMMQFFRNHQHANDLFVSYIPTFDPEVIPLSSETLEHAKNVHLPVWGHWFLPLHKAVLGAMEKELAKL